MNDFDTQLTALLDDTAAQIDPRPNFDAVRSNTMTFRPDRRGGRRFPRSLGVAAATIALLGGGVAAFDARGGGRQTVSTSSDPTGTVTVETTPKTTVADEEPVVDKAPMPVADPVETDKVHDDGPGDDAAVDFPRSAHLGASELTEGTMVQKLLGQAAPGETIKAHSEFGSIYTVADSDGKWKLVLRLTDVPVGTVVPVRVTFSRSPSVFEFEIERHEPKVEEDPEPVVTTPKPAPEPVVEPKPQPQPKPPVEPTPVAFTVDLGWSYNDDVYMKQGFHGSAPVGSAVSVNSEWGAVHATADAKGNWETLLKLTDVPDGTVVHVWVVSSASDHVVEYDLVRDRPDPEPEPEPEAKPFKVELGAFYDGDAYMKQGFHGTGTPGSTVRASSDFGAAETVIGPKGHWELLLKMYDVPGGSSVGVLVTNSASDAAHDFTVVRPESEPEPIEFTANAALTESDADPMVNEYWGTAPAGAVITISSAYGDGQVTANGDGVWDARIEFASVPVGETFTVKVKSSKSGTFHSFSFTRVDASS